MAYDVELAERVRRVLATHPAKLEERRMFGGLCFMVNGAMCCGVLGDELIVRVGRDQYEEALASPFSRVFDLTGRPSRGMVYVRPDGIRTTRALKSWVQAGLRFLATESPPPEPAKG